MEAFWGFHKNHFSRIFNVYCGEFLLLGKLLLSSVVLFVLLGFGFVGSAAADATMWSQVYGGPTYYSARAMVATSDGGYAIAGRTGVNNNDFWLIKTDEFGYMEWNQTYGGTHFDYGNTMVKTADGGYAIAGSTHSISHSIYDDVLLVKTDEYRNEEWNRTYGGPNWDGANSVIATSDGGYVLAGVWDYADYVFLNNGKEVAHGSFWLIKTDMLGNMEWNRTYTESDLNVAYAVVATSDGGYAMVGETRALGFTSAKLWLVKTNETGFIPEHPSFILSSLLMTTTLVIVIYKKKPFNRPQKAG